MKRFLVFILIFLGSAFLKINACGYYPFGEEIRYCFLNPDNIGYKDFRFFNYTSTWNYGDETDAVNWDFQLPNISLWSKYCKNNISDSNINQAVYELPVEEINKKSKSKMIQYLYRIKDVEAINYLIFAKKCEYFTVSGEDDWERKEKDSPSDRNDFVALAKEKAAASKNEDIKARYLFLAIRLSYYNGNRNTILSIYNQYFKKRKAKNILDYWALYFRTIVEKDPVLTNFYAAQVFANALDKRVAVRSYYDKTIPISETLKFAATREEIANVWLLHSIKTYDKALKGLNGIYENNPESTGLSFLLLREMNKLEDWILTPKYSLFLPSLRSDYWENSNASRVLQRVEVDRKYAKELLDFINKADLKKVENPNFWLVSKAYLLFLTKEYHEALKEINTIEKIKNLDPKLAQEVKLIKGLLLIANQEKGKAIVPNEVKNILLEQFKLKNYKYIFAIGRELEEKGNTTEAALLFSKAKGENADYYYDEEYDGGNVYWKTQNDNYTLQDDFYSEYSTYLDAFYSANQIKELIEKVQKNKNTDVFSKWQYDEMHKNISILYDILGTIYIRENKLEQALSAFRKMDSKNNSYYLFSTNPFFRLKYSPDFETDYKKRNTTKAKITKQLIAFLAKANNPKEKNRDYYYFLAANCYYNMTYNGSSWEMRRRFRSSERIDSNLIDNDEYYDCTLAKEYYSQSLKYAQTEKFKALCVRLIAKCDENKRQNKVYYGFRSDNESSGYNPFEKLKEKYPRYYSDLTSNCTYFEDYFKARR